MEEPEATRMRSGGRYGRQAEAERNDVLVLNAARAVFAEQGAEAPVSAIAARAGVGIATLYRRYGSKDQLLQRLCATGISQTIDELGAALDTEGTGWETLARYMEAAVEAQAGAFAALAGTFDLPDDVAAANEHAKGLAERLLRRGHDDTTVRADVTTLDITHLIELFSRYPRRTDEDVHARRRMLALALDGLRFAHAPLPGPEPRWADYHRTWEGQTGASSASAHERPERAD
ncbi:TetR/AcrR family transcriptional regulator [Streptomyces rubiginosohelvolus]|uniref:TetR/AcrR family transcriptional regulator n=1 Tax=Streptomyces rubiginosohelvolus TaxID=67362 RepID=UPI0038189F05